MPTKHRIAFHEVTAPITGLVTKFGGQPNWFSEPQWPLSRETENPMQFVCQIKLTKSLFPNCNAQMAYLFMTDEPDAMVDGTWEPDGGENAVILQPGTTDVPTAKLTNGPTLYKMVQHPGHQELVPEPCEFEVTLIEEMDSRGDSEVNQNKVGGVPSFLQGEEFPFEGPCRLLLQLDSCSVPFFINFGDAGVGYAFLNETGDQAKFLWQCC